MSKYEHKNNKCKNNKCNKYKKCDKLCVKKFRAKIGKIDKLKVESLEFTTPLTSTFICNQPPGTYGGILDDPYGFASKILVNVDNLNALKGPFNLGAPATIGLMAVSALQKWKNKIYPVNISSMTIALRNNQNFNVLVQPLIIPFLVYSDGQAFAIARNGELISATKFLNGTPNNDVLNKDIDVIGAYETKNVNLGSFILTNEQIERMKILEPELVLSDTIEIKTSVEFSKMLDLKPAPCPVKKCARIWYVNQVSVALPVGTNLDVKDVFTLSNNQVLASLWPFCHWDHTFGQ